MEKTLKITLSALLLLCLFDMPYSFYGFVRYTAMFVFIILAYFSYKNDKIAGVITFIALALLFQPFYKIALGRVIWNFVDTVVSIGLLATMFVKRKNRNQKICMDYKTIMIIWIIISIIIILYFHATHNYIDYKPIYADHEEDYLVGYNKIFLKNTKLQISIIVSLSVIVIISALMLINKNNKSSIKRKSSCK